MAYSRIRVSCGIGSKDHSVRNLARCPRAESLRDGEKQQHGNGLLLSGRNQGLADCLIQFNKIGTASRVGNFIDRLLLR